MASSGFQPLQKVLSAKHLVAGVQRSDLIPFTRDKAIGAIMACVIVQSFCSWNPCQRPTTSEALQASFLLELLLHSSIPSHQSSSKDSYTWLAGVHLRALILFASDDAISLLILFLHAVTLLLGSMREA
ncbi:uncharacterized protein LOC130730232 [Lotus japonicus]|uniref:uncharacterized protein LOC130730232 n=1 Tax=Lotus japonicus TaxID=34305 RepID=UPI00258FF209|nr:uncharacterized protein LOC130730232 [Lotus japonicus]